MKCPRDGTELAKVQILDVELDKCHKCDGIWFDPGELDRIRDMEVSDVEEALERKYGDPEFAEGEVENYMRCPRCQGRLHKFNYTYGSAVHIDRCGSCFGIWLDDGELDAIIGRKKELEEKFDLSKMRVFMRSVGKSIKYKD